MPRKSNTRAAQGSSARSVNGQTEHGRPVSSLDMIQGPGSRSANLSMPKRRKKSARNWLKLWLPSITSLTGSRVK